MLFDRPRQAVELLRCMLHVDGWDSREPWRYPRS